MSKECLYIGLLCSFIGLTPCTPTVQAQSNAEKLARLRAETQAYARSATPPLPGSCALGQATADLDANNVRARLYNAGNLFRNTSGNVYTVPKDGEADAIFASNIWIGGLVEGALRFAGATYSRFEFWPGPLDQDGNPPADCALFDRIFKVSRADVEQYEQTGMAAPDLADWPWHLGAPVEDGDGIPNNYDLAGGDRPKRYGDQTLWWVMNDAGGVKEFSETAPLGLEVQVTAYASASDDALDNTTFYAYKILYKGKETLEEAYVGLWADPDLGDGSDDFVGSDPARDLGFVYNGADFDRGFDGYGDRPPALGYVIVEGLRAEDDGLDNDDDGETDEAGERRGLDKFIYYTGDSNTIGDPCVGERDCPQDLYNGLRGLYRDGAPLTFGDTGYGGDEPTDFAFPAPPTAYWSEENIDDRGTRSVPNDKRFVLSMGPLTMNPGDAQDFTLAIVWSQAEDRLASVYQLKRDVDALLRGLVTATEEGVGVPENFAVRGNYPNPFNPTTTLVFDLPQAAKVSVTVYDLLGRRVLSLAGQPRAAGFGRQIDLDALALASGMYLYRIVAQGVTTRWQDAGRMVLAK